MPKDEDYPKIYAALRNLGIRKLLWVGGDDSAKSLAKVAAQGDDIKLMLAPKTIDDDVNLPGRACTLGTQSCAHYGAEWVRGLQVNCRMLDRTYAAICMGRHSGRLPWHVYKQACRMPGIGRVEVLLTKEFFKYNTTCATLAAVIVGSRIKFETTHQEGLPFAHTVIIGENIADILQPGELGVAPRMDHGNIVLADLGLARALEVRISELLETLGRPKHTKLEHMGVAPRGSKPIQVDIDLAHAIARHAFELLEAGQTHRVVYQSEEGHMESLPFAQVVGAEGKGISRKLSQEMIDGVMPDLVLLNRSDLESPNVDRLAGQAGISVDRFRHMFGPAVEALFAA